MKHIHRFLTLLVLAALILGCSKITPLNPTPVSPSSGSSNTPSSPTPIPASITDPIQGLSTLPAYRATFTLSFDGTQVSKPSQWSQSYILNVDTASKG
jgi:hypothetical protein